MSLPFCQNKMPQEKQVVLQSNIWLSEFQKKKRDGDRERERAGFLRRVIFTSVIYRDSTAEENGEPFAKTWMPVHLLICLYILPS